MYGREEGQDGEVGYTVGSVDREGRRWGGGEAVAYLHPSFLICEETERGLSAK